MSPGDGGPQEIFSRDFFLVLTASFSGFLSFYLIQQPALPLYVEHLGGAAQQIGWVGGAFSITTLVVRPFVGRAVDLVGRRLLILVGGAVFVACAPLYAVVGSIGPLIVLRLVHGAGMAAFTTSTTTYATDLAPPARRAELIGYFGIGNNLALGLGPLFGSLLLAAGLTFHQIFFIAGGVAAVILASMLPADESPHRRSSPGWHWRHFISLRAVPPAALMLTVSFTYGALGIFIAVYGAQRGLAQSTIAWFWLTYAGTLIVVRLFSGRIADRFGRAAAIIPGLAMIAASMLLLAALNGVGLLVAGAILYAAGFGFVYPALLALTIDRVGPTSRGIAMATFSLSFDLGIGIGSILGGVVAGVVGYSAMYVIVGCAPLLGLAGYVWMRHRLVTRRQRTEA